MPMTQVPSYIGDDAFKAFLSEHGCRTSFEEIRMRFLGAKVADARGSMSVHRRIPDIPQRVAEGRFMTQSGPSARGL